MCCHWQPPHRPKTGQAAATRAGDGAKQLNERSEGKAPPILGNRAPDDVSRVR